ncbi:hypothetical protein AFAEC_1571 [Aliarcobacter faecis]|uniref:hypothetical protein n=1 Tax=Aliarcobacter faecis TaxID=1564138 RepID=UPI00047DB7D3|nr:hypothetical protein [Aliarcobacter faecis]QKF73729.1 hypothetical protein AFAEC_1571 [Aliarcobacter faecis]
MKKYILAILTLGLFTACSSSSFDLKTKSNDYTYTTYVEPLRYNKENGGHLVVIAGENHTDYAVFQFEPTDNQKNKEIQEAYPEFPYTSYWKIGRNPLGMEPNYSECGEYIPLYKIDPVTEEEIEAYNRIKDDKKLDAEYRKVKKEEARLREIEREEHNKKRKIQRACENNISEIFNSQTTYKYYYAKMPENHLVHYPKKSELHFRWNLSFYIGGVNDLKLKSVPEIYKNNLDKLRSHKCHKWGGIDNTCYDLPNGDKNIYYALREELYTEVNRKKEEPNKALLDVRVSEPLNWIQIDGIEINKDIFDYLEKVCNIGSLVCHLNDYTGALTQEQKEYIQKVKWKKDVTWTDELWKEKAKMKY